MESRSAEAVEGGSARVSLGHRPALDGLRALAVVAVFAYHLDQPWARGGFLGVDLFMVLSGFLITSLLLAERTSTGRVSLGAFWVRRIRRIVPAVVAVLLGVVLFAGFWATPIELAGLRWDALASLTFWANWRFIESGSGYWAKFGEPSPLTHFWSLAVEEQFYLVWPLVVLGVLLVSGGSRRWLAAICAAGIVTSIGLMIATYDDAEPSRAYLGTDTRIHTLLIGALLAVWVRPIEGRPMPAERRFAVVGLVAAPAALAGLVLIDDRAAWMYHGGFAVFAMGAAALVVASCCSIGPVSTILRHPALRWVGIRSFGIYLWHWPLIVVLTPARLGVDGFARDLFLVALTLVVAAASYRFVERPLRGGASPSPRRRVTAPWAVAGVAMAATAGLIVVSTAQPTSAPVVLEATDGASPPERSGTPAAGDVTPTDEPVDPAPDVPPRQPPTSAAPEVPERPTIERILIQGDSVAMFTALPAVEAFAAAGVEVVDQTAEGLSLAKPEVFDAIDESGADVSIWQISLWDVGEPDVQRARYRQFVDASLARGMDVVFVDQPPVLESLETEERLRLRDLVRELAAEDPERITVLDPTPVWGSSVEVDRDGDGTPERWRDLIHVCPQGAARWVAWLLDELGTRYDGIEPGDPAAWVNGEWLRSPKWDDAPGQCDPV